MFSLIKHEITLGYRLSVFYWKARKKRMREAEEKIMALDGLSDQKKAQYLRLYKKDYKKTRSNFSEWYYGFKMYDLSDKEKKSFLTKQDLAAINKKYFLLFPEQPVLTKDKERFLRKYAAFVRRKWLPVSGNSDPREIDRFVAENDTIVKPMKASLGIGVFKIEKGTKDASQIVLSGKLPAILEECVENIGELAEFHPSSLNTIRIVTLSNGTDVRILGCALRTGTHGNVCDNAETGGFFAAIDPDSGTVISNGVSKSGEELAAHPDSGKPFKGFQIPMWEELKTICTQVALYNKQSMLIGWDFAVTTKGVELIEGNSCPGTETLQVPLHKGIRKKLFAGMKELRLPYRDVLIWIWLIDKAIPAKRLWNKIRDALKRASRCYKWIPCKMNSGPSR